METNSFSETEEKEDEELDCHYDSFSWILDVYGSSEEPYVLQ